MKITKQMLRDIIREEKALFESRLHRAKLLKESGGKPSRVSDIEQELLSTMSAIQESVRRSKRNCKTRR